MRLVVEAIELGGVGRAAGERDVGPERDPGDRDIEPGRLGEREAAFLERTAA